MQDNVLGWFEIPVTDMDRAILFYDTVLGVKLVKSKMEELEMAWFPHTSEGYGSGGALVKNIKFYKPSVDGSLLYLSTSTGDLEKDATVIEKAGGKILHPRKQISPEHGFMLVFIDTEGNRVALHSNT
jgi:predicted enzyme related to lactoylglutathione lyase